MQQKQLTCPEPDCGTAQLVYVQADPEKFYTPIKAQAVPCVKCGRNISVLDTPQIVDGPYEL